MIDKEIDVNKKGSNSRNTNGRYSTFQKSMNLALNICSSIKLPLIRILK